MCVIAAQAVSDDLISQIEAAKLTGYGVRTIAYHVAKGHLRKYLRGYVLRSQVLALFTPELRHKRRSKYLKANPLRMPANQP